MTKDRLLDKLSTKTKLDKAELNYILIEFFTMLKSEVKKGNEFTLPGLGKIHFVNKGTMISNLTGQEIPKHLKLQFKFNTALSRYVRVMSRQT